jgi:hypothetical protein
MMNGWQVAKAAREIDPTFPIVYMTGAAAADQIAETALCSFAFMALCVA